MKTLSGWKQISTHMNQAVRTVQRWEILGLPVHRMGTGKRAQVIAFAEELDAWERTAPRRLLDEIEDLKNHIAALESEVRSLKGEKRLRAAKDMLMHAAQMRESARTMRESIARHKDERNARSKRSKPRTLARF